MVVQDVGSELLHNFVVPLRKRAFEKRIRCARLAHRVNDIASPLKGGEHIGDDADVVLQIGIERNHRIVSAFCMHQTRQERVLMASVSAELESCVKGIGFMEIAHDLPRCIDRAVVDEQNAAFSDHAGVEQAAHQRLQASRGFTEHLFLVVARHDDAEARLLSSERTPVGIWQVVLRLH